MALPNWARAALNSGSARQKLDALVDLPILPIEEVETSYYLRLHALDKPGGLAEVTRILADLGISIESILQK